MSKMLRRSTRREIFSTFGRFISIFAIVAIGVAFFSGVRISNDYMLENADLYLDDLNFYDFRVITPLGANAEEVGDIAGIKGVNAANGAFTADALASVADGDEAVYRFHSVTKNVNKLSVVSGRLPLASNECVLDSKYFGKDIIGSTVSVSKNNKKEASDKFENEVYTVVGTVTSPLYMNFERGGTSVGNGKIAAFVYLTSDAFTSEGFDEIYVDADIPGAIYSEEYDTAVEEYETAFKESVGAVLSERIDSEILSAKSEIAEKENELKAEKLKFEEEKKKALDEFDTAKSVLDSQKKQLDEAYDGIEEKISALTDNQAKLLSAIDAIRLQLQTVTDEAARTELDYALKKSLYDLDSVGTALKSLTALNSAKTENYEKLDSAVKEYEKKYAEAVEAFEKAEGEFADAEEEIRKAYEAVEVNIDWNDLIYSRYFNMGFACFENDVNIVDAIARVFPIFFFAVAALVCMTTMARMIDEQRTVIGTLIALGHKKGEVRSKYMWYSGIAAVGGCLFGFALGTYFIPKIIRIIYTMMYDFKDMKDYVFFPMTLAISLAATLVCSLGVTWISLRKTFAAVPAELMRPEAPSNGGKILLEQTGIFWEKTPFLNKVTARNIFRYKKRMFMMILGICGCTALLLTGFGLKDSICNIVDDQYGKITLYDSSVILAKGYTDEESFNNDFSDSAELIDSYMPVIQFSSDIMCDDVSKAVTVLVTSKNEIAEFIDLHRGDDRVAFPTSSFIAIDESLAKMLGADIGSVVRLSDADHNVYEFTISALFENYIGHYVIMSSETFANAGGDVEFNTILFNHKDGTDPFEVSARLSDSENVLNVTLNKDSADRISSMLSNMNYVILIVLLFASSLAFVVLFNLTNINITERKREIATLKVLGFTEKESRKYIFRENNILTFFGALVGIPFGYLLHLYCMEQIKIDLVTFIPRINLESYFISYGLTVVFVVIVNLLMRSKITAVDMTGSLKSAE